MLLTIWAIGVLERTIESALREQPVKEKAFRSRRDPKNCNQERDQQKKLKQTQIDSRKTAFQPSGIPAALIALTVKKTIDARLKMVVTIAIKFVSILKRLKKRRTTSLCKIVR